MPQEAKRCLSPRPLAISCRGFAFCREPENDRTQPLRQDTPPNALARDRCWWQISWLAGHRRRPPSQEHKLLPVAILVGGSPLTVAGAAVALRAQKVHTHHVPF